MYSPGTSESGFGPFFFEERSLESYTIPLTTVLFKSPHRHLPDFHFVCGLHLTRVDHIIHEGK